MLVGFLILFVIIKIVSLYRLNKFHRKMHFCFTSLYNHLCVCWTGYHSAVCFKWPISRMLYDLWNNRVFSFPLFGQIISSRRGLWIIRTSIIKWQKRCGMSSWLGISMCTWRGRTCCARISNQQKREAKTGGHSVKSRSSTMSKNPRWERVV